jgi:hypothetical protein
LRSKLTRILPRATIPPEFHRKPVLPFLAATEIQMTAKASTIDRLRIATPCPISWEQMAGDDRVRFCDHCHLNVYNISELTRIEAEALIASSEGRICARLFRRADGTVLTKDCPVGLRALRRRVAKRTAAIFAAIISLTGVALGQNGSSKDGKTSCTPQTKITRTKATSDATEKPLSGTAVDPMGATIPGATVKLRDAEAKELQQTRTNEDGRFEFGSIQPGTYSIAVEFTGFKTLQIRNVVVEKDKLTSLAIILEPANQGVTVGLLLAEPSLIVNSPGTMIFDEKMIQRLPHQK